MIRFFNTLSGKLEEFKSLREGEVRLYTCGPTVYDFAHIGNYRAFVFEDLLRRFLEFKGFRVRHVMNITDVDDKTIAGADKVVGAHGRAPLQRLNQFTEKYIEAFHEDLKSLNISPPTAQPRATQEVKEMIRMIEALLKNKHAYESGGSVYFRVSSFQGYGGLSKKKLEGNVTGARVDVDEYEKEAGADFALWKKSKEGEPSWDSPWGKGRPGWHVECSAMSMKYLGDPIDIHCGGEDLIFPHHENEIAQSEAATGKTPFVKYWLHCKHLLVNGEKMSKSKDNYYTLRDLLAKGYDPMAIRYALLAVQYRQPMNFTLEGLRDAEQTVEKLRNCYAYCFNLSNFGIKYEVLREDVGRWNYDLPNLIKNEMTTLGNVLSNDLNVSIALACVSEIAAYINFGLSKKLLDKEDVKQALSFFSEIDALFGLAITEQEPPCQEVLELQRRRDAFRGSPLFKESQELQVQSDAIRKRIQELGWDVKDGRPGEPSMIKRRRRISERKC